MIAISREERVSIQNDTIKAFDQQKYLNRNNQIVEIPKSILDNSIRFTQRFSNDEINTLFLNKYKPLRKPLIMLVTEDCLNVGLTLQSHFPKYSPCVLNMASDHNPGGGYKTGANAQEESLFRRSNLHQCLDTSGQKEKMYPIPILDSIYTSSAVIIKDANYKPLDSYKKMSFIASAAICCTSKDIVKKGRYTLLSKSADLITRNKVANIFKLGIVAGHNALILSAYGCGAYKNPPFCIATICNDMIKKYAFYYDIIIFAIFDDDNAFRNSKTGNVSVFSNVLNLEPINLADCLSIIQEEEEKEKANGTPRKANV